MNELVEFDPEIKKIEDEIKQFLLSFPLFALSMSITSLIKVYFITRENLTQDTIRELTKRSKGKISQELKKLLDQGFIEKSSISSKGEITYTMKSASRAFIMNFLNSQKEIFGFFNEINDLKDEMDSEKEALNGLLGYNYIYDVFSLFSSSLPLVETVIEELENEFERLE
jgi:DNA-binding transcriptional regulator GbsR (MarR family)